MGEARRDALRVGFDRAIKLEFHGARVSSDAGLFPYRDLDEAALLRQSVYSRLAGYEDVNDDPVMRHVVGGRSVDCAAVHQPSRPVRDGDFDDPQEPEVLDGRARHVD